jgi:cell division protein DivIC
MAKKVSKQSKRRLMILVPLAILAIFSCIFTVISMGYNLYTLHEEEAQLKSDLTDLKKDAKDLKTEINKLQDKDYVARYARENYLYTKDGEYVIKVDEEEEKKTSKKINIKEEYIYMAVAGLTFLIIIYIFIRHYRSKKKK